MTYVLILLFMSNELCVPRYTFCNANRHMSNWFRRNAFDFVKHYASTTPAHSVRQIALALTLLLFIFDMEHWISAEAFYIDLIH